MEYRYKVKGFIGASTASKFATCLAEYDGIARVRFTAFFRRLVIESALDGEELDKVLGGAVNIFNGKIKIYK